MLYSKVGVITLPTSTGLIPISCGFEPKVILFTSTPATSDVVSTIANLHWSFGMVASGGYQHCIMANARNGVSPTDVKQRFDNSCVVYVADPPGTDNPDYVVTVDSFTLNGFVLNITDAPPVDYRIGFLALGGDDINGQSLAYPFTISNGVGPQNFVGFPFAPDLVVWSDTGIPHPNTPPLAVNSYHTSLNWLTGLDGGKSISGSATDNLVTSAARRYQRTTKGFTRFRTDGNIDYGYWQEWLVDGWKFYWESKYIPQYYLSAMAIDAGAYLQKANGELSLPTSAGEFSVTGLSFQPKALLIASSLPYLSETTTYFDHKYNIAFVDEYGSQFLVGGANFHNVNPSNSHCYQHSGKVLRNTNSAGAITEQAYFVRYNSDGFTLFADTVVGSQPARLNWLALGTNDPTPPATEEDAYGIIV